MRHPATFAFLAVKHVAFVLCHVFVVYSEQKSDCGLHINIVVPSGSQFSLQLDSGFEELVLYYRS